MIEVNISDWQPMAMAAQDDDGCLIDPRLLQATE
jgi:hypothetical protein